MLVCWWVEAGRGIAELRGHGVVRSRGRGVLQVALMWRTDPDPLLSVQLLRLSNGFFSGKRRNELHVGFVPVGAC